MNNIEIRSWYSVWHPVPPKKAYRFIKDILNDATMIDKNNQELVNKCVSFHLRGITWDELKSMYEGENK